LIAHWALDEPEGFIAHDSAGNNDGACHGEPLWQPAGGKIDGALAFDGTDDYVSTDFVLNPADGAFSVFAWVKGGAPGQVIISQADRTIFGTTISTGSAWLSTDPAEGKLMTELLTLGQGGGLPVVSETVITDGNWHRIGLVYDGSSKYLYVDGTEVGKDTEPQPHLESASGGLYFGAGNNLEPGSFFSGLIDDVRIYDRALTTIDGFTQTGAIQECEFELVVSDGELTSLPDTVKIIIVPDFGTNTLTQEHHPFDRNKPTIIYFGGGDCVTGSGSWGSAAWSEKANIISFPNGYSPDSGGVPRTYYKYGDMIIVYLSSVAPDYKQPIQTSGYSTGGQPAIDVGIRLNLTYRDARYAVNHFISFDATGHCRDYSDSLSAFLGSSVDGEQCWAVAYVSTLQRPGWPAYRPFCENVLNVWFPTAKGSWAERHQLASAWYRNSLMLADLNNFNHGLVAGAYWSVVGPGKNLQLASIPDAQTYKFQWYGDASSGYMDFYDEPNHPGRLPEPVTLVGPTDGAVVDANGAVFSCEVSENAVGYQLLFGRDPYHMVYLFSDTPSAPAEPVTPFPFEQCWWTVRAYDEYGSTIHADPMHIKAESVIAQTIENATTGQTYASIQQAINDAHPGDEIVVNPGVCQYLENVNFKGKSLTVRSTDPSDPTVVAATVINGGNRGPVVTVSGTQETDCLLAGLTILGGTVGVSCRAGSVTIRNCTIESNGPIAIEFWEGYEPQIVDCTILGQVVEVYDPALVAYWKLDEAEGMIAYDSTGDNDGTLHGNPAWQPTGGQIGGALELDGIDDYVSTPFMMDSVNAVFSVFAWVKGGMPGQVIFSQAGLSDWLGADTTNGSLMTELKFLFKHSRALQSQTIITDGNWHRIGLVWDGSNRILYVDDVQVASDTYDGGRLYGGLQIGAGKNLDPGSFFSGLTDDVRIYDQAVTP
jgi:hypothetical protein